MTEVSEPVRMDPDLKARWVAALRSGKYTQARAALRLRGQDGGIVGHCCLGVLCELVAPDSFRPASAGPEYNFWWDTRRIRPLISGLDREFELLMVMNDDTDVGFAGIADYIEENL